MNRLPIISFEDIPNYLASGNQSVTFNVSRQNFGNLRNGDMIALLNLIAYYRKISNNSNINCRLLDTEIDPNSYCKIFKDYLTNSTNYFGNNNLIQINETQPQCLWETRRKIGEYLKLDLMETKKDKVVIFPLFDAKYNIKRNWDKITTERIFKRVREEYKNYEKIICIKDIPKDFEKDFNLIDFKISQDFKTNINHILTSRVYVGGDTGLTHFTSVLQARPQILYYVNYNANPNIYPFYLDGIDFNICT